MVNILQVVEYRTDCFIVFKRRMGCFMESYHDRRIVKTKKLLYETLLDLLVTTPLNHITVKKLCDKADINRNTFYYHFNCIDDLLLEIINNFKKQEEALMSPVSDMYQYALELCLLYKQNTHLVTVLLSGNVNVSFIYHFLDFNYLSTYSVPSEARKNPNLTALMTSYIQVSTFTIIAKWLEQHCSPSESQIAHILCQLWNTPVSC